ERVERKALEKPAKTKRRSVAVDSRAMALEVQVNQMIVACEELMRTSAQIVQGFNGCSNLVPDLKDTTDDFWPTLVRAPSAEVLPELNRHMNFLRTALGELSGDLCSRDPDVVMMQISLLEVRLTQIRKCCERAAEITGGEAATLIQPERMRWLKAKLHTSLAVNPTSNRFISEV
ncbi:MAG: hypothetical protein SGPRY_013656, partial [Prymnesium sp.]